MHDPRDHLLLLAEAYCAATGRSESRIATIVGGSGTFFARLRAGAGVGVTKYMRIKAWFAANWPGEVSWPAGVPRAAAVPDEAEGRAA